MKKHSVSKEKIRQILELMQDGKERTSSQAADELNLVRGEVCRAMKTLHDRKDIHIVDWCRPAVTGGLVTVYAIGTAPDKERPTPTRAKKTRKKKACVSHKEKERRKLAWESKERLRKASEIRPFRHWQDSAFYGEYQREAA